MAKRIGSLSVTLGLNSRKFTTGMQSAGAATRRLVGGVARAGVQIAKYGAVAGGVAAAATAAIVKHQMSAIDATAKFADSLGYSIEQLQAHRHAANLAGADQQTFDKSVQRMTRNIGDAARGIGSAGAALEELGLDVEHLARMSPGDQFEAVAEAVKGVENQTLKASTAYQIFGRDGIQLVNVLNGGRAGLKAAAEEVERFGGNMNRIDAAKVELANDAITRLGARFKFASQALTVQVVPWVEAAANKMLGFGVDGATASDHIANGMERVARAVAIVADYLNLGRAAWAGWQMASTAAVAAAASGISGVAASALDLTADLRGESEKQQRQRARAREQEEKASERRTAKRMQGLRGDFHSAMNDFRTGASSAAVMDGFNEIRADAHKRAKQMAADAEKRAAQSRASAEFLNSLSGEDKKNDLLGGLRDMAGLIAGMFDGGRREQEQKQPVDLGPLSLTQAGSAEAQQAAFAAMADSLRVNQPDEQKQQLEEQRRGNSLLTELVRVVRNAGGLQVVSLSP